MKKTYKIDVDCANCANKMEQAAKETAGVADATVNFMALKMNVEFEDGADVKAVMEEVLKNCKKVEDDCEIFLQEFDMNKKQKKVLIRIIAAALMMAILLLLPLEEGSWIRFVLFLIPYFTIGKI